MFPLGRPECPLPLAVSTMGIPKCLTSGSLWWLFSTARNVGNRTQNRERWAGSGGEGTGLCTFRRAPQSPPSSAHVDRETVHVTGTGIWDGKGPGPNHGELSLRAVSRAVLESSFTSLSSSFSFPTTVGALDSKTLKSPSWKGLHSCPSPSAYR